MPLIQITLLEGRTEEQKEALIEEVTLAVHRSIGAPLESIRIALYELPKSHWAVGGKTMAKRGRESSKAFEEESRLIVDEQTDETHPAGVSQAIKETVEGRV
ncbi:MAG: 2-hydroxymuconate tautomerase family protein [Candidatus Carbobacillus altaicus]|nr:2-hydroxymuconate tautomerase family protein [Candidatus Carbobacillus altaicus]